MPIYTDEDKINRSGTAYFGPHFKPDFSMALLQCNNYICHLFAVRRDLLKKVGLLNPAYDGAQDYDFVLRCAEQAKAIGHIPKVLYTGGHIRHRRQATPRARSMRLMQGEGQSKHTISGAGSQPGQRRLRCAGDTAVSLRFRECRLSRS